MAAGMGGGASDAEEPSYSQRLKDKNNPPKKKKYLPSWAIDPRQGGETTPAFGEDEISSLPIKLGYSIIDKES
jgi:hypothetical protein